MAKKNNPMMFDGEIITTPEPLSQRPDMMYISQPSPFVEEMTFGRGGASNLNFRGNQGGRGTPLPSQPYSRMAPNRSTMMSPYDNYDYGGYNFGFPNFNNPNIVPTQARVPEAPPVGYRPGIDAEFNYFPTSNPPASTMGQYPYGITPPTMPPIGIGSGLGSFPDLANLFGGVNFGDTTAGGFDMSNLFQNQNTFQQPVIDYDLLASKINVPNFNESQFQMPDYSDQFSNLQQGLGGLTDQFSNFQIPTYEVPDFDYNQLASNLAGQIDFPTYDVPDYSGQFQGLQQGIGNLTDIFGNFQMPTYETPDYGQQFSDLSGQLSGLSNMFGNFQMPTYETPDYSQQFSDLSSRLGGLESLMRTINNQENNTISGNQLTFAEGGDIRYQEGQGIAGLDDGMMTEGNEQLIQAAIMVIQGMAPDQETADAVINQFIGLYGQEAFMSLREQVLNPDGQTQTQGMIEGFGGGMDDFVQGVAGNQNRIAASPGEYIVPADVVSQLGDGNSEEGSRKLDGMLDRTRMAKTGTIKQAEPIDSRQVMPV
tara:strand:+ start:548 stop:2161 length:1614 start_codon:yes stop_codon:yes gene_type:complete